MGVGVMRKKGKRAEGWLSSKEDDSRSEKERVRDTKEVCLATRRQRPWGPRAVLTNPMGELV